MEINVGAQLQRKKNELRKDLAQRGVLKREGNNSFDRYKYFSEAQYKALFTELFSLHQLELRSSVSDYSLIEGTEKQSNGRQVTMEFELIDVETGHSEKSTVVGEGFDKGDKAGYKAMTGALKYYLACTFLVATGDDPEKDSPEVKMNTRKISPAQKAVIEKKYTGERLQQLLDWAKVKSLDEMSDDQAFKVIMQIKEREK